MKRRPSSAIPPRTRIELALEGLVLPQAWDPPHASSYAIADALLSVQTDSAAFRDRFLDNYGACAVAPSDQAPDVVLQARAVTDDAVLATFERPVSGPLEGFPAVFLPTRREDYPATRSGWRTAMLDHPVGPVAYGADGMVAALDAPWEALVASMAVNCALSVQPRIMFFHGAAIQINGRGLLLLGVSGAGKTSVSLALAARGHDFYGDDIVGVRLDSRSIVPLRRAAHVRAGPAAPEVARALGHRGERPAGARRLADVGRLFPQAGAAAAALDIVVCLRHFTPTTSLTAFSPRPRDLQWVTPHVGSLHAGRPSKRAMQVLSLFSGSSCFFLDSASPQSAADTLEQLTE